MLNLFKRRLDDDPSNIELRHYCIIEMILNEKWNDLLDLLEETPHFHFGLIEFAFKYFPLTMINNERIRKIQESLKFVEICRNEKMISSPPSSSSSSFSSIESLDQSILFSSKGKFYKKSVNWIRVGKGECEIIEKNQSGDIFLRFWLFKNHSINLVLLVQLNQSDNFSLLSTNSSSFLIEFQSKNECEYPLENSSFRYQIEFYSIVDMIQFKEILSLRKME